MPQALPTDPPWLKWMLDNVGLAEIKGAKHNPKILAMAAAIERPDIQDDETAWCAIATSYALKQGGIPLSALPPKSDRTLARSYVAPGLIAEGWRKIPAEPAVPRGAVTVIPRGNSSWQGHVFLFLRFVTVKGIKYVEGVGGNQTDSSGGAITIDRFRADKVLGFMWPPAPVSTPLPGPAPWSPPTSEPAAPAPAKEPAMGYTHTSLKPEYARRWGAIALDPGVRSKVLAAAKTALAGKEQYRSVEAITGTPWAVIAAIHYREASCSFKGVLHNGDQIIGTGQKTIHDPKGRGPFKTWIEAAVDALRYDGLAVDKPWSVTYATFKLEAYNGFGYRKEGFPSAYLWASTNQHDKGKYVEDGQFSPTAEDKQVGVCALLWAMMSLDPDVSLGTMDVTIPPFPSAEVAAGGGEAPAAGPEPIMGTRDVQSALVELGYDIGEGGTDGKMGPDTRGALREFQAAAGISVDGRVGPETSGALRRALAAKRKVEQPAGQTPDFTETEVRAMQQLLWDKGFTEVGFIDGAYGASTRAAVTAFQTEVGLPPTGSFDKTTAAELALYPGRKVGKARAEVTAPELRKQGDTVTKQTFLQRIVAWTGLGSLGGGLGLAGLGDVFTPVKDAVGQLKEMFSDIPSWVWIIGGATVLLLLLRSARATEKAQVEAVRTGVNRGGFTPDKES